MSDTSIYDASKAVSLILVGRLAVDLNLNISLLLDIIIILFMLQCKSAKVGVNLSCLSNNIGDTTTMSPEIDVTLLVLLISQKYMLYAKYHIYEEL